MEEKIYLILKSLTVNEESYFESAPSTWCDTAEDAAELLEKTAERFKEWYPDLKVLGHDEKHLYIRYTDDDGAVREANYWVRSVRKFDGFAW